MSILSAEAITIQRGRARIYERLTISFGPGITAILGPNGAGKTTLIEGLLHPSRLRVGTIKMDEKIVPDQLSELRYLARVGHMPQDWKYFSPFTARESVEYVAWLKAVPSKEISARAAESLHWVNLTDHADSKIRRMSGGMQQRVGLAEAFVNSPRIVLLDEPTVGLDPAQRNTFRKLLKEKAEEGSGIVLSTHLIEDVDSIADRVVVILDGRVVFDGTPKSLADQASTGSARPLEAGYLAIIESHTGVN